MATTATLFVGNQLQLTTTVFDALDDILIGRTVVYQTSDPSVATVNSNGLIAVAGAGFALITASCESKSDTCALTCIAPTLEMLLAQMQVVQPGLTMRAIEAGRGHSLTAGNKATVTDVFGASDIDLNILEGAGFHYDPATNLFDTEAPNTGSAGVDSMQTAQSTLLGNPHSAGHGYTIALVAETHQNAGSTEFGMLRSGGSAIRHQASPGGQNAKWPQLDVDSSFGSNNSSSRGQLPFGDGNLHLFTLDLAGYNTVVQTPPDREGIVALTGDRDLCAFAMGENSGWTGAETTMRLIVGRGWPGFDQPGSWKWRNILVFNKVLIAAARDILYRWARAHGVYESTKPHVIGIGNSFVANTNASSEGLFKRILSDLGTQVDCTNLGLSSTKTQRLIDRIPFVDYIPLTNARRTKRIVFFFEWLNSFGDGAASMLSQFHAWSLAVRALLQPTDPIIVVTPNVWSSDPTWLATFNTVRTALLSDISGTYFTHVCDWGNPAWIWGTTAILSDATRLDPGAGFHPTIAGYDELAADPTHGLIPVIRAALAA